MNRKLFEILTAHPNKFPKNLSKLFPHILGKISDAWGTDALDDLFADLLVAEREGRTLDMQAFGVWRFEAGLIAEHWENPLDIAAFDAFWS